MFLNTPYFWNWLSFDGKFPVREIIVGTLETDCPLMSEHLDRIYFATITMKVFLQSKGFTSLQQLPVKTAALLNTPGIPVLTEAGSQCSITCKFPERVFQIFS